MNVIPISAARCLESQSDVEKQRAFTTAITRSQFQVVLDFIAIPGINQVHNNDLALRVSLETKSIELALEIIRINHLSNDEKQQAVCTASINGYVDVVRALLEGDLEIGPDNRAWAVELAAKHRHLEVVKELLSKGATISEKWESLIIASAVEKGYVDIAKFLKGYRN